jgi:hypothetical protein
LELLEDRTLLSNLIINGDFEQGNTGFMSGYQYSPGNLQETTYDVVSNPDLDLPNATLANAPSFGDHTTGHGLMFAANGATAPNVLVWKETISVLPGTDYVFSLWDANWSWGGISPATLNVIFNNVSVGMVSAPSITGTWSEFKANWNSGTNTSATVTIIDLNTVAYGNDFALDDISLVGPTPQTTETAVSSSINSSIYGQPVTFTATVTSSGTPVSTGAVNFEEGNTVLAASVPLDGNGHASLQISPLTAGLPTITANYSGSANFQPSSGGCTLTVWPAPLLVVAANASRPYGAANPVLTDTIVGIQNNDQITATCYTDATPASPAGDYSIVPIPSDGGTGKLSNYAPTIVNGTLTITPDPLLVTSLADDGPGSLRSILANAPAGSTVHFGVDGTITLTSGPLDLSQDVTLAGPGDGALIISGNKTFEVFRIGAAATVTISSLTIAQGESANFGGGIYNDGTLTLSNSTITDNFASPRGGGIYNSPTGTMTLNQSVVSANSATNAGGAIFNDGTLTVNNSSLADNGSTDADGGAIFNLGTLTLTCSTFWGNGGTGAYGGAVRNDGLMTVQECTLANNRADLGGAFYNMGTLIVSSSTISLNTAVAGGGGVDNGGALLARNTIFAEDSITTGTGPDLSGVLISLGHNLFGNSRGGSGFRASDLLNVNPRLGPLQYNGGPTQTMALLSGSPTLNAGDTTDAPAYDQRGLGYLRIVGGRIDIGAYEVQPGPASPLIVTSSADDISQPGTLRYAIAHASSGDTISISPALTNTPIVLSPFLGELLLNIDLTIKADPNAPATISAAEPPQAGWLVPVRVFEIASNAHVTLSHLIITNGHTIDTSLNGGGIYNSGVLAITDCTLSGNSAYPYHGLVGGSGGGIFNSSGTVTITNSTLSGNSASDGGAIANDLGTIKLTNSIVSGNSALVDLGLAAGGGIYNYLGTVTISSSTLSGNRSVFGGGIANYGTVTITNSAISDNNSLAGSGPLPSGGGIYNSGKMTITHSSLFGNDFAGGPGDGGAVYNSTGTVTITNSDLTGNIADYGNGGGIYNDSGTVTITNSTLSGNTAVSTPHGSGGGIYANLGTVIITNSNLLDNSATQDGGGIYNYSGTVTITASALVGNAAKGTGGGIDNFGTVMVSDSVLSNNSANIGGGITNFGTLTVSYSVLTSNSATAGGGIMNNGNPTGGTLTITSSTVTANSSSGTGTITETSASGAGGGIFNNNGALVVTDWLFIENNTGPLGDDLLMLGGTLNDRSKVIGTVTYYE